MFNSYLKKYKILKIIIGIFSFIQFAFYIFIFDEVLNFLNIGIGGSNIVLIIILTIFAFITLFINKIIRNKYNLYWLVKIYNHNKNEYNELLNYQVQNNIILYKKVVKNKKNINEQIINDLYDIYNKSKEKSEEKSKNEKLEIIKDSITEEDVYLKNKRRLFIFRSGTKVYNNKGENINGIIVFFLIMTILPSFFMVSSGIFAIFTSSDTSIEFIYILLGSIIFSTSILVLYKVKLKKIIDSHTLLDIKENGVLLNNVFYNYNDIIIPKEMLEYSNNLDYYISHWSAENGNIAKIFLIKTNNNEIMNIEFKLSRDQNLYTISNSLIYHKIKYLQNEK